MKKDKNETDNISGLERTKIEVEKANPDLPMGLRFEVSTKEVIEKLMSVSDLTMPTPEGSERNVIGRVFDSVNEKLVEYGFSNIETMRGPSKVSIEDNFDNLLFSEGNAGRSSTYTRYIDENNVLRTHASAYIPEIFRNIKGGNINIKTFMLPGLAYRRDVIDPKHLDVFHQIDIWTLQEIEKNGKVTREDLLYLVRAIFEAACPDAEMIVYEAKHPYTVNGIEVYAKVDGKEIEVLEAGLIHPEVLKRAGLDPEKYCGLASGMGVERLIMARKNLPDIRLIRSKDPRIIKQMLDMEKYIDISNQPAISRDMSYCVDKDDREEDICEEIREAFGDDSDLLEEVKVLERTSYRDLNPAAIKRLGAQEGQDNVLVRIILRHPDKTLVKKEAARLYSIAYPQIHKGQTEGYTL